MTLEEMEAQPPEAEVESPPVEKDSKKETNKKTKDLTNKIFKCLFGKDHHNLSGKDLVGKILSKALEESEDVEEDFWEALGLLEGSLRRMEQVLNTHPQLVGVDLVDQIEEVVEFLDQWGLGQSTGDARLKVILEPEQSREEFLKIIDDRTIEEQDVENRERAQRSNDWKVRD